MTTIVNASELVLRGIRATFWETYGRAEDSVPMIAVGRAKRLARVVDSFAALPVETDDEFGRVLFTTRCQARRLAYRANCAVAVEAREVSLATSEGAISTSFILRAIESRSRDVRRKSRSVLKWARIADAQPDNRMARHAAMQAARVLERTLLK